MVEDALSSWGFLRGCLSQGTISGVVVASVVVVSVVAVVCCCSSNLNVKGQTPIFFA